MAPETFVRVTVIGVLAVVAIVYGQITQSPAINPSVKVACTLGVTCGVATLASGTQTVTATAIGALSTGGSGDVIALTEQSCSGTCAGVSVGTVVVGASFVINGAGTDNSKVFWEIRHIN